MKLMAVLVIGALGVMFAPGAGKEGSPVCIVSVQAPVMWNGNQVALTAVPPTSNGRQRVQFTTEDGQKRKMEIIYGSTVNDSDISLTVRNAPEGTANIQYPEGPGLHIERGWAFITYHWPLIWMDSIDAGSIGTTSVLNNQTNQADIYLVSNKLDTSNPVAPNRPSDCQDPNAHLYVKAHGVSPNQSLAVPTGYQAVRVRYGLQRDAQGHVTSVSFKSKTSLKVTSDDDGRIHVEDDQFLQKVLDCANLQGLYEIP